MSSLHGQSFSNEAARRLHLALSTANEPAQSANWIAGFLKGSGLLLLHDSTIWSVLDQWVTALPDDTFTVLLPLLRRSFSEFSAPERHQMGERVTQGKAAVAVSSMDDLNCDRANAVLPLVAQLLGVGIFGR
ncbi:MAG: DUF5682 family protein [Thermosynechococcaceae cyanobacterium]